MLSYLINDGWSRFGGVVSIGRGVAAGIGVCLAGGGGRDALVAGLNQRGGGGLLLTQHPTTAAGGVARGGGDRLVVGLLRELVNQMLLLGGRWLGRCNRGRGTCLTRQTSIGHHYSGRRIRKILKKEFCKL